MDNARYHDSLAVDADLFIAAIEAAPDAAVPQCGDWTNRELAIHLGGVWQWATANALAGGERGSPAEPWKEEGELSDLLDWLRGSRDRLVTALKEVDLDGPAWTFAPNNQTTAFWLRRMAHETAVHRWDAESASRTPTPIAADIASDGIDECIEVGLQFSSNRANPIYPSTSIHLHCTDTDGEWTLAGNDGPELTVTREHAKGDAAVRGPANNLLLWVWGRDGGDVDIFGDADVATTWRTLAP